MSYVVVFLLGIFFLFPILSLFGELNWNNIQDIVAAPGTMKSFRETVVSSAIGSALSVIIGLYFARILAFYEWPGRRLFRLSLIIPYLIPNFVLATAYILVWNPTSGLLKDHLPFLGPLYGLWGMTFLFGVAHMPVALLLIEEKLKRIDMNLREASQISGASNLQTFFKIDLPLLMPTLLTGFLLGFALNSSAFAIPAWIGSPEKVYPLTYRIYQAIQMGGVTGIPKAAVYSMILLVLSVALVLIQSIVTGREKKYVTVSGRGKKSGGQTLSFFQKIGANGLAVAYNGIVWFLPLTSLGVSTLVTPGCLQQKGWQCFEELTLRNYSYVLFELSETRRALFGSFIIGGGAALTLSLIAMGFLILVARRRNLMKIFEAILQIPVSTPGAVLALGLIIGLSGRWGINLYNTIWIVGIAFWLKHASLAFQPLRTGYMNLSTTLIEAAQINGASIGQTWRSILIPLLRAEWVGGFFLVFIPILGELTMSVFLAGPNFQSIGTLMFDLQDYADQAAAQALGVLLIIAILFFNEMARRVSRGSLGY